MRKKRKVVRLISQFICVIALIVMVVFLVLLRKLNVLPMKFFIPITGVLCFLEFIYIIFCLKKKTKIGVLIFFDFFAIIFIILEVFASTKIHATDKFLDEVKVKETRDAYYIVVNSESEYKKLDSIKNKIVYYFDDGSNYDNLRKQILNDVKVLFTETDNYSELMDSVIKDKTKIILISDSSYNAYFEKEEEDSEEKDKNNTNTEEDLKKEFRILKEYELVEKIEVSETNKDITSEPFIIYLSGIDTRKNKMPSRSLSDVNMYLVVNPKNRKILMVSIPRDYYVKLHGKTGLNDKLTHAGIIGGVKLSKATIKDLLGIEADYYVRLNFNAVIKLVDTIGGITVNSDVKHSFKCWTDRSCVIHPGDNKLNGKCALAFARERHAYKSGDRHRGENQQQVIKKVFNKITSSKTLISKYEKILDSLKGTFETDLSTDNITSLIQFQLNDMKGWNFETYNLDGNTGMDYTYSYPNRKLSIMYQNPETVKEAQKRINQVLNEK